MKQRRAMALTIVALGGCVGDDPGPSQPQTDSGTVSVERFLGRWTGTMVSQTVAGCPIAQMQTIMVAWEVKRGTASDVVLNNVLAPDCLFAGKIAGDTATFDARSCAFSFPSGEVNTYDYPATNTLTLTTADGSKATITIAAILSSNRGPRCDFSQVGSYTKQ
jgi:hypothetical protein